jgi:hypothetical protein
LCVLFAFPVHALAQDRDGIEFFEAKIRPVLVENCFKCHTGKKPKADLLLDSRAAMFKGSDNGPAVVTGEPDKSLLMKAIRYEDANLRMPPKGKLADAVIADFAEWIRRGAPWPEDAKPTTAGKVKEFDLRERARHWSLQPLQRPATPAVKNPAWPTSPIDYFILSQLEANHLTPAPSADRRMLIRRVTYDLTGLPPTRAEIDTFLKDESADAYARLVDRLLGSPQYAERWARHWLDLVRFAETFGHEFDVPIPEAWRYRDYVIRACAADLPYDRLVTEHIAGDLLSTPRWSTPLAPSGRGAGGEGRFNESVLGTGFWWLGEAKHSPVDSRADQADRIDNQIDVFGKAFLGLTLACARCHDHKFDAVSTKDYYAIAGYLQSSRQDLAFLDDPIERAAKLQHLRGLIGQIKAILPPGEDKLRVVPKGHTMFADFSKDAWQHWFTTGEAFGSGPTQAGDVMLRTGQAVDRVLPGLAHSGTLSTTLAGTLRSPTFTITQKHIHMLLAGRQARVRLVLNGLQLIQDPIYGRLAFTVDNDTLHWRSLDLSMWLGQRAYVEMLDDGPGYAALAAVAFSDTPAPPAIVVDKGAPARPLLAGSADAMKLQALVADYRQADASVPAPRRGLATADGSAVDEHVFVRGSSSKLGPIVPRHFLEVFGGDLVPAPKAGSGRLELARQLTDPARTPLVPRVMVNRLWKHHFVEGIVRTPDDFGVLGQPPTHPELLDFLASEFVKEGWSLKKMHRLMVLSSAYRMSSHGDARADEADPDNKLVHRMPMRRLEAEAIRDAMLAVAGRLDRTPFGIGVMPHLTPFMVGRGRPNASGPLDGDGRRSIYLNVRRNFLNPMFLAFDYPTPFTARGRRSVSNVPAQALTMMNNPLVQQQAERWARRTLEGGALSPRKRLERMYEEALGRLPTKAEAGDALAFVREFSQADEVRAWTELAHVLFNVKEFIFVQ